MQGITSRAIPRKSNSITVRIEPDSGLVTATGRDAWMLQQLIDKGARGCTAADYPAGIRLGHYVWKLRRLGLVIETSHEAHTGPFPGSHARYRLHTAVSVVSAKAAA